MPTKSSRVNDIKQFTKVAIDVLNLSDWEIETSFHKTDSFIEFLRSIGEESPEETGKRTYGACNVASADSDKSVNIMYKTAKVGINLDLCTTPDLVKQTVVHELLHIAMCYIAPDFKDDLRTTLFEQVLMLLDKHVAKAVDLELRSRKKSKS